MTHQYHRSSTLATHNMFLIGLYRTATVYLVFTLIYPYMFYIYIYIHACMYYLSQFFSTVHYTSAASTYISDHSPTNRPNADIIGTHLTPWRVGLPPTINWWTSSAGVSGKGCQSIETLLGHPLPPTNPPLYGYTAS